MASDRNEVAGREPDQDRDRRLYEVLAAYLQELEAGRAPDRAEWLARYPDRADELAAFLDEQDRLLKLTEPLRLPTVAVTLDAVLGRIGSTVPGNGDAPQWPGSAAPGTGVSNGASGARGRDFGDYELIEPIAHGGMGAVFKARQRSLNRLVALKLVRGGAWATDDDRQRFRQEVEAVAHLDHANIVPIYEVGEQDGLSYFSMRLAEGGSLARRIGEYANDPAASARLLATLARAIDHAHHRGILHRDVKPSNVLLDEQGQPHLSDFGLARRLEGDCGLTQSGAIVGTPSYMAPEQASGKRGVVTPPTTLQNPR